MRKLAFLLAVIVLQLTFVSAASADLSWHLRNSNSTGPTSIWFYYGINSDVPVVGDWDYNQTDTPGIFRTGAWHLRNANSGGPANELRYFGQAGDKPVPGGWGLAYRDVAGIFRDGVWHVQGYFETETFQFGEPGDTPLVLFSSIPVVVRVDGLSLRWFRDDRSNYGQITYGASHHIPVTGDWDGDGEHTPGVYIPGSGQWHLRNSWSTGSADIVFTYGGAPGDTPITGDWNGDGIDTVGIVRRN